MTGSDPTLRVETWSLTTDQDREYWDDWSARLSAARHPSLARVVGPLIAVPLFFRSPPLPYWTAIVLMAAAVAIFLLFARRGRDYNM